jgi:hypothetical protein
MPLWNSRSQTGNGARGRGACNCLRSFRSLVSEILIWSLQIRLFSHKKIINSQQQHTSLQFPGRGHQFEYSYCFFLIRAMCSLRYIQSSLWRILASLGTQYCVVNYCKNNLLWRIIVEDREIKQHTIDHTFTLENPAMPNYKDTIAYHERDWERGEKKRRDALEEKKPFMHRLWTPFLSFSLSRKKKDVNQTENGMQCNAMQCRQASRIKKRKEH